MGRDWEWAAVALWCLKFQSTRPRGARPSLLVKGGLMRLFQSTRPRGARRAIIAESLGMSTGFNPRARVGRDEAFFNGKPILAAFQSTRPRGARHLVSTILSEYIAGFNPRARVGRDSWRRKVGMDRKSFNPRARVGRDPYLPV